MSYNVVKRTVCLSADTWKQLDAIASQSGSSRSEVVRLAVFHYLDFHAGRGANPNRLAELAEFNQLVLDQILKRDFADLREQVLDAVDKRLGKFHGR